MNDLTTIFLANSLFIWGVHVSFKEGMIFGKIDEWLFKESVYVDDKGDIQETKFSQFLEWIRKPIIGCPACMGFWWGMPGAWIATNNLFQGFVYCTCMIGFNYLISEFKSFYNSE